jgi:hypothetical protein
LPANVGTAFGQWWHRRAQTNLEMPAGVLATSQVSNIYFEGGRTRFTFACDGKESAPATAKWSVSPLKAVSQTRSGSWRTSRKLSPTMRPARGVLIRAHSGTRAQIDRDAPGRAAQGYKRWKCRGSPHGDIVNANVSAESKSPICSVTERY